MKRWKQPTLTSEACRDVKQGQTVQLFLRKSRGRPEIEKGVGVGLAARLNKLDMDEQAAPSLPRLLALLQIGNVSAGFIFRPACHGAKICFSRRLAYSIDIHMNRRAGAQPVG